MKKRTIIFCSFIITTVLLSGCGCGTTNEQVPPSSTGTPSATTPQSDTTIAQTAQDTSSDTEKTVSMISEAEAKEIALSHADLVEEEVTFQKSELDRDTDGAHYDIEFYTEDRLEYDYDVDAYTGEILSYEWDEDELFLE